MKITKRGLAVLMVAIVAATALPGRADVKVGDKPQFAFTTFDRKKVTSRMLRGRIVIIEHWATWCPPCVAQVPHLKEIHEKYSPKGVVMISISHDRNQSEPERFVKEHGIKWPQVLGRDHPKPDWGVQGIPHAFILSPEGEVLWRGHPARMEGPLEEALKKYPPKGSDRDGEKADDAGGSEGAKRD